MTADNRRAVVEALLFASSKPLAIEILSEASGIDKAGLNEVLGALQEEFSYDSRGFTLEEVAGGYQLRSDPRFSTQIGKLFAARIRRRMTRSSLESLSIIAYRQPVTRAEIEQIRGVDSGAVLKTLLSLSMIRILGRKEAPGRPILYGTTRDFLEYFGLRDIESLPTLEEVTELLEEADTEEPGARSREPGEIPSQEFPDERDTPGVDEDGESEFTGGDTQLNTFESDAGAGLHKYDGKDEEGEEDE